jgi:hypothetical protein
MNWKKIRRVVILLVIMVFIGFAFINCNLFKNGLNLALPHSLSKRLYQVFNYACKIEGYRETVKKQIIPENALIMRVIAPAPCYYLPYERGKVHGQVQPEQQVRVALAANNHYEVWIEDSWCGWVKADALSAEVYYDSNNRSLALLLAPLITTFGEILVNKTIKWFDGSSSQLPCGQLEIYQETMNKFRITTPDGMSGYVNPNDVTTVSPVFSAQSRQQVSQLMVGGKLPENSGHTPGLMVEGRLLRPNGQIIWPSETLQLGEAYDIAIHCSRDCYVRITCETPEFDNTCQYHPSGLNDFKKSRKIKGGEWVQGVFLPSGVYFQVREPLSSYDLIRIEANTYAPYSFLPGADGDGCASRGELANGAFTGCSRGGAIRGLDDCRDRTNQQRSDSFIQPQAEAISEIKLLTTR